MEVIPPEIWTEIFSFACTDDGSTGRTLSAVSRAVHIISKPLKYQSVCVLGPEQLLKLLRVLCALSPGARKVRYLFVGGLDESAGVEGGGRLGDHSAEGHRQLNVDTRMDVTEQALFQILHLISPSLVALHIHRTKIHRPSVLLDMELPMLSELTLYGPFKSSSLPPPLFPSLRRIRIHHFVHHPTRFLEHIVHAAARITHLHVPQCSFSTYDVQVALGIVSDSKTPQLPNSIQRLVIELETVPSSPESWASNIRAEQRVRKLQKISQRDGRIRLVDGRDHGIPVVEAKEKWLEGGT
ncbi:hypothetical protein B0H13DRAFT_681857 [Mycena leptocephala]|nr:hypothetical protein B0H13DRAFT_681857 [Mycena leptocephala]